MESKDIALMFGVVLGAGYVVKQALSKEYLGHTITIGLVLGSIGLIENGLSCGIIGDLMKQNRAVKELSSFTLTVITGLAIGAFGAGMLSTASTAAALWVIIKGSIIVLDIIKSEREFNEKVKIKNNILENILGHLKIDTIIKEENTFICKKDNNVVNINAVKNNYREKNNSINTTILAAHDNLDLLILINLGERRKEFQEIQSRLNNIMEVLGVKVERIDSNYTVTSVN